MLLLVPPPPDPMWNHISPGATWKSCSERGDLLRQFALVFDHYLASAGLARKTYIKCPGWLSRPSRASVQPSRATAQPYAGKAPRIPGLVSFLACSSHAAAFRRQ